MPVEQKLHKVSEFDPRRCQGVLDRQQCPFMKVEGSEYCIRCQRKFTNNGRDEKARNYQLGKWQARVNQFSDHDQLKSLREEIGISRLVMENLITMCKDEHDLLLYSTKIMDNVTRIEKVVAQCHRLEQLTSSTLDKTAILQIGNIVVEIISRHIEDADVLDKIAGEIIDTISSQQRITVN